MDSVNIVRNLNLILAIILVQLERTSLVEITALWVPDPFQEGSKSSVLLDCVYNYEVEDRDSLEVKWYFNRAPAPFCQWIAGVPDTRPQLIGSLFEDKVDLEYVGGTTHQTKYRALLLHRPTTAMAGTTCGGTSDARLCTMLSKRRLNS